MFEALGLDSLLAEMIVAIGLALVLGNGFAYFQHRRGVQPEAVENPVPFRTGRVIFLTAIGVLMTTWGLVSILGR